MTSEEQIREKLRKISALFEGRPQSASVMPQRLPSSG